MTRKTTKRALGLSFVSLLLCITMLMGTTFAWFTDNASAKVNTIQSGKLDVTLEMWDGEGWVDAEGKTLGFVDETGKLMDKILWEPGCSFLLQPFKITNNGNLALKFDIVVSGFNGDAKLAEAIEYGLMLGPVDNLGFVAMGDLNSFDGLFDGIKGSVLNPGDSSDISGDGVTLHMKETAGNEYQNLTLDGMSITIIATQATVEEDSYDDQYDANATYPIATKEQLDEALADEAIKDLTVVGGYYDETVSIPSGKTFTSENGTYKPIEKYDAAMDIKENAVVNLKGGNYMSSGQQILNVQVEGAKVTIDGGTFDGSALAWICGDSEVVINDGTFNVWTIAVTDAGAVNPIVINGGTFNLGEGGFTAGTNVPMIINGGTFNQDPTNWLGEGKTVTEANGVWTVK